MVPGLVMSTSFKHNVRLAFMQKNSNLCLIIPKNFVSWLQWPLATEGGLPGGLDIFLNFNMWDQKSGIGYCIEML